MKVADDHLIMNISMGAISRLPSSPVGERTYGGEEPIEDIFNLSISSKIFPCKK